MIGVYSHFCAYNSVNGLSHVDFRAAISWMGETVIHYNSYFLTASLKRRDKITLI